MFFPNDVLPNEVTPVPFYIGDDFEQFEGLQLTLPAYSFDMRGLSKDVDCETATASTSYLNTNCSVTNQGSGAPLFIMDAEGNTKSLGVVSVGRNYLNSIGALSEFAVFKESDFEDNWPSFFEKPAETCMRVSVGEGSRLMVRNSTNSGAPIVARLPFNDIVTVDSKDTDNGWIAVEGATYQGYSSLRFLEPAQCAP